MFNCERVGLIFCFFIPALWQGNRVNPTLSFQTSGDACDCIKRSQRVAGAAKICSLTKLSD
jgi:hypothetical protein